MKLRKIIKNKRAGYLDIFIWMIFSLVIVFISVIFIYMTGEIKTNMHEALDEKTQEGDYANWTELIEENIGVVHATYQSLHWISAFLIIGMILAILIGSYLVTTKPVFFVPYIFIIIIAVILGAELSNAYETVMETDELSSTFEGFTASNFIMLNLPIWVAVIGIAGGIIMFTKMIRGGEYYEY